MTLYPLLTILDSIADTKGKRRLLYKGNHVGGISRMYIAFFLFSLPFIEYALIFNPFVFELLGIATAIVFFIIFLSIVMLIVCFVVYKTRKNTIQRIKASWEHYFPQKDLEMVISSRVTPYSDFFTYYAKGVEDNLSEDKMKQSLEKAFITMEEENKDLLEAMNRQSKLEKQRE